MYDMILWINSGAPNYAAYNSKFFILLHWLDRDAWKLGKELNWKLRLIFMTEYLIRSRFMTEQVALVLLWENMMNLAFRVRIGGVLVWRLFFSGKEMTSVNVLKKKIICKCLSSQTKFMNNMCNLAQFLFIFFISVMLVICVKCQLLSVAFCSKCNILILIWSLLYLILTEN